MTLQYPIFWQIYPMNKLSAQTSSQNWGRPKDGGFAELEDVLNSHYACLTLESKSIKIRLKQRSYRGPAD